MRPIPSIDITAYAPAGPLRRPVYLDCDVFYRPVEVPKSTELEGVADQAVESLLEDGYHEKEALDYVGLRIHAAASFAITAANQDELQRKVVATPGGPTRRSFGPDFITPTESLDIAPFLPLVTPYDLDLEKWLETMVKIQGDWEVTQSAIRWLKLFDQQVSRQVVTHVLTRCVEADGRYGTDEIALYSGRISEVFADAPEITTRLLDMLTPDQTLALFGELGLDMRYWGDLPIQLDSATAQLIPGVRQIRHVDHYPGDSTKMDRWHAVSLFNKDPYEDGLYGDVVTVSVNGQVVGSIEMIGEQSMLALRNVKDAEGKFPLVAGGVYVLRQEVVDRAKEAFKSQEKWAHLDLDSLEVRPLRFLNITEPDDLESINQTLADIAAVLPELEARLSSQ